MKIDTLAVLFIFSRSDVSHPRHCTAESNEHIYEMWRTILIEINMEQLIHIFDKQRIKTKSIFESDIFTSRSKYILNGYKEKFHEFLSSLKESASTITPSCTLIIYPDIP